jgi:parallel beta-helix repeat protein
MIKMKKIFVTVIFGIILIISFSQTLAFRGETSVSSSSGDIIYVGGSGPGNYTSIQEAINNSSNISTVFVFSGEYNEDLLIDKPIKLIGENKTSTFIKTDKYAVIQVTANMVNISGFTIINTAVYQKGIISTSFYNTISGNIIKGSHWGIIANSNNNITNNIVANISYMGIVIDNNNTISGNYISNCHIGISCGDYNWQANDNIITDNIITKNNCGIHFEGWTNNNIISGNNISLSNDFGITLFGDNNTIIENNFSSNNNYGIFLAFASNNLIYHNNFFDNHINAFESSIYECYNNSWNYTYPIGGNYWHDYLGVDEEGDGIGDTPYNISNGFNKDYLPLIEPWEEPQGQEPVLSLSIKRGLLIDKVSAKLENIGNIPASDVTMSLEVEYGFLFKTITKTDIVTIFPGEFSTIEIVRITGLGFINVKFTVRSDEIDIKEIQSLGLIIGRFIFLF